jgi:competence protein ComEC
VRIHPLFCVLSFALGDVALQSLPELPDWPLARLFALAVAMLLTACLLRRRLAVAWSLCLLACFGLGLGWAGMLAQQRLAEVLPTAWEGQDIQVVGVIAELPNEFGRGVRFTFQVERSLTPDAVLPPRIALSWYRGWRDEEFYQLPHLHAGERWQLTVRLKQPHGNANPHAFDYEGWLFERGLRATGYVRKADGNRLLAAQVPGIAYRIERLRQTIRDRFQASLPQSAAASVLAALAVGDQQAVSGELWRTFANTGTSHLMSISGLHVTMLAALCGGLVGFLWRRLPPLPLWLPAQRAAIVAGWLAAAGYTLLAGAGVPALRTLAMLSVCALAMYARRNVGAWTTLGLALLAVLLWDPWAVLAAGFWLSFGAVAALFVGAGGRLGNGNVWSRFGLTQWAATLGTLPLLLFFFHQFSLVSPLANAVAIPAISFVVTPLALLAALLQWDFPLWLADGLMRHLLLALDWLATLPLSVWAPPAPPWWVVLLGLLGVFVLLLPRGFPGKLAALALLAPALLQPPVRPVPGEAAITVLDVGQGLAVLVRTAEHSLLYDAGPYYSPESDAGQRIAVPYLRAIGVSRLDTLVVTHQDSDHSGGAASVLESLPVSEMLDSLPERHWLRGRVPATTSLRRCQDGQHWLWDGVEFAILHPTPADYAAQPKKANHLSCVLRVVAGGKSLLLTSDIEAPDEAAMLARPQTAASLHSDVVLAPHHGSRTSSTPAFVAAVGAQAVIFPMGYRNRFGHPRADVWQRWAATGAGLWRSDRDGALTVRLPSLEIEAERAMRQRYWQWR